LFFNDTATTEIYTTRHTLSLHDALPISPQPQFAGRALELEAHSVLRGICLGAGAHAVGESVELDGQELRRLRLARQVGEVGDEAGQGLDFRAQRIADARHVRG